MTEHNRWERVLSRVRNVYASAEHHSWTHERLLEEIAKQVRGEGNDLPSVARDWAKLSGAYKMKISGYEQRLREEMWQSKVQWRHLDKRTRQYVKESWNGEVHEPGMSAFVWPRTGAVFAKQSEDVKPPTVRQ